MDILTDILKVTLASTVSLIALFFLTKLMGNRQIAQLSMFDYINGITIGSIAAEIATTLEGNLLKPLTALILYCVISTLISVINGKSLRLRRFLTGESLVLFDKGIFYRRNLKRARLDLSEFLFLLRNQGYFHLQEVETAILESNGQLSILPTATARPATPSDLELTPPRERPELTVILDGTLLRDNLKATCNDETWLQKQLHRQKMPPIRDVFLATCDSQNTLHVYLKTNKGTKRDLFE